jgi:xanthine dehydrogenase accessory factor
MAVSDAGDLAGSVSGGCVEGAVATEAQEVLASGVPKLLRYGVTRDEAWAVGLACGGTIEIFVELLD